MITIHATKKLMAKLPKDNPKQPVSAEPLALSPADQAPLGSWHANILILEGQDCLLFVHDITRFPVFIKQLESSDLDNLSWHFEDGFMNTLLKVGAQQHQLDAAAKALAPLQFDRNSNRSVQGTMTRMAGDIEHILALRKNALNDISAYSTSCSIAEMLTKIKGMKDYIKPHEQMLRLLDDMASAEHNGSITGNATMNKVVKLDDYR